MCWQVLPVTDGVELEGACEALALLLDRRQAFYRHAGAAGTASASDTGVEGAELLSFLSEEDWRAGVGFADWVGVGLNPTFNPCVCMCVHDACEGFFVFVCMPMLVVMISSPVCVSLILLREVYVYLRRCAHGFCEGFFVCVRNICEGLFVCVSIIFAEGLLLCVVCISTPGSKKAGVGVESLPLALSALVILADVGRGLAVRLWWPSCQMRSLFVRSILRAVLSPPTRTPPLIIKPMAKYRFRRTWQREGDNYSAISCILSTVVKHGAGWR